MDGSNKFGLPEEEPVQFGKEMGSLGSRLATFQPSRPKNINLEEVDSAAAQLGFVSREPRMAAEIGSVRRTRRKVVTEPTRNMGIRLGVSQYERFVAYADKHRLSYHDALMRLLDQAGDQ